MQTFTEGDVFNYTASGAIANGALFVKNRIIGVALTTATGSGQLVAIATDGVFKVACTSTGAMVQGALAYYRTTGSALKITGMPALATGTTGTTGLYSAWCAGTFWETAASGETRTTVPVRLIGGPLRKIQT